eukprot:4812238-Pyramimonas_sp.AAC.1
MARSCRSHQGNDLHAARPRLGTSRPMALGVRQRRRLGDNPKDLDNEVDTSELKAALADTIERR